MTVPRAAPWSVEPDPFQLDAFHAIDAGRSVLVAAPTGAGKTLVAEHAIEVALAAGRRAFYTTPVKALSNQKYRDLCRCYGESNVGLLTGDRVLRPDAAVVVMTTEVLRNMLYGTADRLRDVGWVVLDEVHFLQDPYRGAVWEEVVLHTPRWVHLVCLSATVANASELAAWLTAVRGSTDVVLTTARPVPLHHHLLEARRGGRTLTAVDVLVDGLPNPTGLARDEAGGGGTRQSRHGPPTQRRTPRRAEVVAYLDRAGLLPAIVFIFSRAGCSDAMRALRDAGGVPTTTAARRKIDRIVARHLSVLSVEECEALDADGFRAALRVGVAAHHAGLVPAFKEAVEECFAAGLVKVVFATETLALGVNMPARSVVLESLTKFTGARHELLTPAAYTQASGRAGRRGLDDEGHVFTLWSPYGTFGELASLAATETFPLQSAFRPTYNMAVNLVRTRTAREARATIDASFASFQQANERARLHEELARMRAPRDEAASDAAIAARAEVERRLAATEGGLVTRFEHVLRVLEAWEMLDGWALTNRGRVLAGIYHESDLLVATALADGVLDDLTVPDLAAVLSCTTYEHRSRQPPPPPGFPNDAVRARFDALCAIAARLRSDERQLGLPLTREPDATFVLAAGAWACGADLAEVFDLVDLSGGDAVRNFRVLADLLQQLAMRAPLPATRVSARTCVDALRRGVVVAEQADVGRGS